MEVATNVTVRVFEDVSPCTVAHVYQHLWYSGQSPWLQIQRSGFDSRHGWNGSGLESHEYGRRDPLR
jgi:hypothetical protein